MSVKNSYWFLGVIVLLFSLGFFPYQPAPILPDLQTMPPSDLVLVPVDGGKGRGIWFTNSILNAGPGDLLLGGQYLSATQSVLVHQVIPFADGSQTAMPMGEFIYHAVHRHWHLEGFSLYEVLEVKPGGGLGDVVATSGKVSFCIRDDGLAPAYQDDEQVRKYALYTGCTWQRQGISVGWLDIYDNDTPGQFIDISHLPDGDYALRSTTNPDGLLVEADTTNNSAVTYFNVSGDQIRVFTVFRSMSDRYHRNGMDRRTWWE